MEEISYTDVSGVPMAVHLMQWSGYFIVSALLLFMAVLFLQSGLDKITDYKGNLEWLKGHFEKSVLGPMVPALLSTLAFTETLAGLLNLIAFFIFWIDGSLVLAMPAYMLCLLNFLILFAGQRIAKDYDGAAGIVPYFIAGVVGLAFFTYINAMEQMW